MGLLGTILILTGMYNILRGDLNYTNHWGGIVFAPAALVMGILVLIIVLFRWKTINQLFKEERSGNQKNNRHEDWKKW